MCEKVMITVTMDGRENPYVYEHPYQIFALGKQMVTSLMKIAGEKKTEIEEPICLFERPVYRFRDCSEMAFLETELFRYSGAKYNGSCESVSLHEVRSPGKRGKVCSRKYQAVSEDKRIPIQRHCRDRVRYECVCGCVGKSMCFF